MSLFKKIKSNVYVRQIFTLASGTSLAHGITIVSYFIITQLYDPVHFGDFSFFHSSVTILAILSTLMYEYAIVLPKKEKNATSIFLIAFGLCLTFTLATIALSVLFSSRLAGYFDVELSLFYLIPFGVLVVGLYQVFTYWMIKDDKYDLLSYSKIIQSSSTSVIQIGAGLFHFLSYGLIFGYIAGRALSNIYLTIKSKLNQTFSTYSFNIPDLKKLAKKYSDQPKFITLSRLLSQAAIEIPVFLISFLFNNQLLGFYGLAYRLLSVPSSLLGTSVGHVSYKHLTDRYNSQQPITRFLLKTWGGLFLIGFIPMLSVLLFGEDIFGLVFGSEWTTSGTIAAIMAPALFIKFVTAPTEKVMLVLGHQKMVPVFSAFDFLSRGLGLYFGYTKNDFFLGVILMTAFQAVAILLFNTYILFQTKSFDKSLEN